MMRADKVLKVHTAAQIGLGTAARCYFPLNGACEVPSRTAPQLQHPTRDRLVGDVWRESTFRLCNSYFSLLACFLRSIKADGLLKFEGHNLQTEIPTSRDKKIPKTCGSPPDLNPAGKPSGAMIAEKPGLIFDA
jgi:hypothetical protein